MKFAGLTRSPRTRQLDIVLPGVDEPVPVLVRALSALEEQQAVGFALTDAKAKGAVKAEAGEPLYDVAFWAKAVATAYVDSESADGAPFFDGGVTQVLDKLPVDSIAYLFQEQQRWQEEVSPSFKTKSGDELVEAVRAIASQAGDVFFSRCSPSTQMLSARFMAGLLVSSPDTSWQSGSRATATTTPSSPEPTRP